MPYCLACGSKTDFDVTDCPDCGEAIRRRTDPPGDDVSESSEQRLYWDEDDAETDAGDEESDDTPLSPDERPLAGIDDIGSTDDAGSVAETAPSRDESADDESDTIPPATDPAGESPFADRWSLSFAAGYPVRGDRGPLVVGSILEFVALVIPVLSLFTAGYGFRLLRAAARGQRERPAFEDYGQLLVEGVKFSLVALVYVAFAFLGSLGAIAARAADGPFGIALWAAVGLLAVYPLPASLTACGATDEFRSAFSRSHAGAFAVSRTYLTAWLAWLVGGVAVSVVAVLSVITLVGPIVVRTWSIYSFAVLWGYYYREAAARGVVPPAPDEPVS